MKTRTNYVGSTENHLLYIQIHNTFNPRARDSYVTPVRA